MILYIVLLFITLFIILRKQEHFTNKEEIIIRPKEGAGLGNYLRVVLSYYEYCKKNNKDLKVLWEVSKTCNGFFLDYFKPLKNVKFIKTTKPIDKKDIKNLDYYGDLWHKDHNPNKKKIFNDLKLLPYLEKKIKSIINNNSYDAIHVRRTDHVKLAKKYNKFTSDKEFIDFVKNTKRKVYLATDNKKTQDKFKKMFSNKIFFNKTIKDSDNLRNTSLEDSIVDILICKQAVRFKPSGASSFSETIEQLRS